MPPISPITLARGDGFGLIVMGRRYTPDGMIAPSAQALLPPAPVLIPVRDRALVLSPDGEVEELSKHDVAARLSGSLEPMVCHAPAVARRLGTTGIRAYDVLELFAFVRPAEFLLPTPRGLAEVLELPIPTNPESEAWTLAAAAQALLEQLGDETDARLRGLVTTMARGGWPWSASVTAALGGPTPRTREPGNALAVWTSLPDWDDAPPAGPVGNIPVSEAESRARLREALAGAGEKWPEQEDFAGFAAHAFQPRDRKDEPRVALLEAGTGVGKTLGYLAPAGLWAERNGGAVWISTFTRNLQRQLDGELSRLFPDEADKRERVVVRKGRENYLCLLNFEEAVRRLSTRPSGDAVALGILVRWMTATRDGDMIGGDFPAWLRDLLGWGLSLDLTDTRGECIYSACAHYGRCFVEHTIRRARRADIVVANHALVMIQAALGGDEQGLPARYVFDEGHHIFEAADSAFSSHLSGRETAELRRWLVGAEEGGRGRSRGLRARIEDLISDDERAAEALDTALAAARALPGPAWGQRIAGGSPTGPAEGFLALVRQQVYARDAAPDSPYGLEAETTTPVPGLCDAADTLSAALARLAKPLSVLIAALAARLDTEAGEQETAQRTRIESLMRGIERRGLQQVAAWRSMLAALDSETPPDFVDWFAVERNSGRDVDVGFRRHWIDPTQPFIEAVIEPAHGALVTSATLRDRSGDETRDWEAAEMRTGTRHLRQSPERDARDSPFDYAEATRAIVIGDVNRNDPEAVAAAYRELFLASGGGGIGLFTAISRLQGVYKRIADPLESAGLSLFAQHVDRMDTGTLVDIFRAEEDSCLLGTDAVRDGVDVPGRSLRLLVYDRVPWPRPTIVHKARCAHFGGRAYDEMLTRLKLKQAFGRLIRRGGDRGVFVMLDRALPSRLKSAFPDEVELLRLGLSDAVTLVREFLTEEA